MGLRLRLRPNERIIVNGCVLTNGDRRNTITVSSFGQVLRGKYVLQPEDAKTPVRQLYFAIQMLLISGADEKALRHASKLGAYVFTQVTENDARAAILEAMDQVHLQDFYKALVRLHPLLELGTEQEAAPAASPDVPRELAAENEAFHAAAEARINDQQLRAAS
ncbi:flagellar biosynthesis repressor FlbT [Parvularcula maris]|uniref:Flagellar biosynthesis repressor FlbT n=1 Tax=Parvularcula maris TaxID=2965077 RepID=A0A9X2L9G7_9PROT|nr:flagellar biosynthesis repressor FlbT [Parvularcula maris]MCQ8185502.1 flagellar biosynthesis repressor FlbT [Parvularcula maris]